MMRCNGNRTAAIFAAIAVSVVPVRTNAQTQLPEITVSPLPQPPKIFEPDHKGNEGGKTGGNPKANDGHALDRLNQQLKRKVDETNPIGNNPPLDARSPDTKTGVVNIPAVQQQYGKNFGHSVVPFRPDRPVFTPPIGPHR
jgi:hypothetical protein